MEVKKLRLQTGLSQSKFAKMFDVPIATLKECGKCYGDYAKCYKWSR